MLSYLFCSRSTIPPGSVEVSEIKVALLERENKRFKMTIRDLITELANLKEAYNIIYERCIKKEESLERLKDKMMDLLDDAEYEVGANSEDEVGA